MNRAPAARQASAVARVGHRAGADQQRPDRAASSRISAGASGMVMVISRSAGRRRAARRRRWRRSAAVEVRTTGTTRARRRTGNRGWVIGIALRFRNASVELAPQLIGSAFRPRPQGVEVRPQPAAPASMASAVAANWLAWVPAVASAVRIACRPAE